MFAFIQPVSGRMIVSLYDDHVLPRGDAVFGKNVPRRFLERGSRPKLRWLPPVPRSSGNEFWLTKLGPEDLEMDTEIGENLGQPAEYSVTGRATCRIREEYSHVYSSDYYPKVGISVNHVPRCRQLSVHFPNRNVARDQWRNTIETRR